MDNEKKYEINPKLLLDVNHKTTLKRTNQNVGCEDIPEIRIDRDQI